MTTRDDTREALSVFLQKDHPERIRAHRCQWTEWSSVHDNYQIKFCKVCHKIKARHI